MAVSPNKSIPALGLQVVDPNTYLMQPIWYRFFLNFAFAAVVAPGSTSIVTLGTITTGTWNATKISEAFGGTNQSTYVLGDILYASATNTLSRLSGNTTATKNFLSQTGNGAISAAPTWGAISKTDVGLANVVNLDTSNAANITTGVLAEAQGGSAVSSIPGCSIYSNVGTTLATNSYTKIKFDTKNWDRGTYFDAATNYRYTPLVSGTYNISTSTYLTAAVSATIYAIAVYKNGVLYKRSNIVTSATTGDVSLSIDCLVQLNGSTDYIEIFGFNGNAITTETTGTGAVDTFLDIYRVSPI